jgi:hypothetical protein
MEDIMEHSEHMQKSGKMDSSGQPCPRYKGLVQRCGSCQRHGNINTRDAMPLTNNLQMELFDVWGIDYMGPFPKSRICEYILCNTPRVRLALGTCIA